MDNEMVDVDIDEVLHQKEMSVTVVPAEQYIDAATQIDLPTSQFESVPVIGEVNIIIRIPKWLAEAENLL